MLVRDKYWYLAVVGLISWAFVFGTVIGDRTGPAWLVVLSAFMTLLMLYFTVKITLIHLRSLNGDRGAMDPSDTGVPPA